MTYDNVFVLGAGAIHDVDKAFPMGPVLALQIEQALARELSSRGYDDSDYVTSCLASNGGFGEPERLAMGRIVNSLNAAASIDQFVDEWRDVPKVAEVAKIAIAVQLLAAEKASVLSKLGRDAPSNPQVLRQLGETWLGTISSKVGGSLPRRQFRDCLGRTAFITFNYDRSLEWYLVHYLNTSLNVPYEEAVGYVRDMPIIHVYGSLGDPFKAPHLTFGAPHQTAYQSSLSIKTYSEEIHSREAHRIAEILADTKNIIFLGCAMHQQNMNILFPHNFPRANVYATCYGMRQKKMEEIGEYFTACQFRPDNSYCSSFMNAIWDEIF